MSETASAWAALSNGIVTATVEAVHGARVDVRSPSFGTVSARLAVPAPYEPRPGDDVLVAAAEGGRFVIGVLRALRDVTRDELRAPDGSTASLAHEEAGAVWRVRDREGRLIFEHTISEGGAAKSVVHLDQDLDVRAAGDISLSAAGKVSIEGGAGALLRSPAVVVLASEGSRVRLDRERARVEATILETHVERADLKAKDANLVVGTLRSVIHRVRENADIVERTAGRLVERAREVYREVEGLSQTKAGRLKLVADTALTLLGTSAELKAREDVKVKGEKIYLG
jgi:hypothetical protein